MPDDIDAAAALLARAMAAVDITTLVRAKCPRCRRWCLRRADVLTAPCYLCQPVDAYGTFLDLLLAKEFGLSAKAYHQKLERYGPPWVSPKEWTHPRSKWPKLRPPADD